MARLQEFSQLSTKTIARGGVEPKVERSGVGASCTSIEKNDKCLRLASTREKNIWAACTPCKAARVLVSGVACAVLTRETNGMEREQAA